MRIGHLSLGILLAVTATAGAAAPAPARVPAAAPAPAQFPAEAPPATAAPTTVPVGTINLDLQGVDAEEAFTALAKQADMAFPVRDPSVWQNADPVFLTVENARFWPTFLDLCRQSRLSFSPDSPEIRGGMIRLVPEAQGVRLPALKVVEAQGLLLIPRSSQRNAMLSYERPEGATSTCSIQLIVLADPSLAVGQVGPVTVQEAVDENGLSLVPPKTAPASYYSPNPGGMAQTLSIALANPKAAGKKLSRLKGYVRLTAATSVETIQIDSPLKAEPVTKQFPDYDVTIQPLAEVAAKPAAKPVGPAVPAAPVGDATYQLKVSFRLKNSATGGPGLKRVADRNVWTLTQGIVLVDAQGRRYTATPAGSRSSGDTQDGEVTFRSDPRTPLGEPAKLTWKLPLGQRALAVPFELTDLPLP